MFSNYLIEYSLQIDMGVQNIINKYKSNKMLDKIDVFHNIAKNFNGTRGVNFINIDNINQKINDYVKYNENDDKLPSNLKIKKLALNITDLIKQNNTEIFNKHKFRSNLTIIKSVKIDKNAKTFDFSLSQLYNLPAYNQIKSIQKERLINTRKIAESSNLIKQLLTTGKAQRLIEPKVIYKLININ